MKWGHIERERGQRVFGPADEIVAFAEARALRVKGHALVWHGDSPAWLEALSAAEARTALREHIRDTVARYRGRIVAWDVVNEAIADDRRRAARHRLPAQARAGLHRRGVPLGARRPIPTRSSSTTTTAARG